MKMQYFITIVFIKIILQKIQKKTTLMEDFRPII
jgi:hypothetical protein